MSKIRITGGELRGRLVAVPQGGETRPTSSRTREAIFNHLQTRIVEANVLDLYAGSGAIGLEAISRGAQSVTFVERSRNVIPVLSQNLKTLNVESKAEVRTAPVDQAISQLARNKNQYDLIIADPPYQEGCEIRLLEALGEHPLLSPTGWLILESSSRTDLPAQTDFFRRVRQKKYGDTQISTYESL